MKTTLYWYKKKDSLPKENKELRIPTYSPINEKSKGHTLTELLIAIAMIFVFCFLAFHICILIKLGFKTI